ncbi:MAG: 2OG-Fe(II) oxygenase [Proteobacteria bacterium]|nr:2OG-Fe(II) oxygenase [Pseudomonadota bacterium]
MALARHHEAEGRFDEARHWLERAVQAGDVDAMAALGELFLIRPGMPVVEGIKLTVAAAERGSAQAAHQVAVFAGAGAGIPQNWRVAFDFLQRSAELGWPLARKQLALFSSDREPAQTSSENNSPEIWKRLREAIDIDALTASCQPRQVVQSPRIWVIEKFLPCTFCDWLIERAKPRIERARIFNTQTGSGSVANARTNSFMDFNIVEADLVVALVRSRIAAATGLSAAGMEQTAILHYEVGQEFLRHYDFLDTENAAFAAELARHGQRVATFLLYLNEDFEGGETGFPLIDWMYKGRSGDAMFFSNADITGAPDRKTLHAGLAPTRGQKWLLSQFIRSPYTPKK